MTLKADLQGNHKPVILVELEFDGGEIDLWTWPFTRTTGGKTYSPIAGLTGALSSRQSLDNPSLDASAQISGSASEIATAALTEQFQRRPARIKLGAIDDDGDLTSSETLLEGKMVDIPLIDDTERGVQSTVEIESVIAGFNEPPDLRLSAADQARFNADDTFFDLVETATVNEPRFGG